MTLTRRALLRRGAAATTLGLATLALPEIAAGDDGESAQLGDLPAPGRVPPGQDDAGHRPDDVPLEDESTLVVQGDARSPYVGQDQLRAFWLGSGSFVNRRFSLVPSYKIQIAVDGHQAWLYFECHDVGSYDQPNRSIVSDTFLAGTIRHGHHAWLFHSMTAGKAAPLSFDHYYFP
jgi:hypothetical protein